MSSGYARQTWVVYLTNGDYKVVDPKQWGDFDILIPDREIVVLGGVQIARKPSTWIHPDVTSNGDLVFGPRSEWGSGEIEMVRIAFASGTWVEVVEVWADE